MKLNFIEVDEAWNRQKSSSPSPLNLCLVASGSKRPIHTAKHRSVMRCKTPSGCHLHDKVDLFLHVSWKRTPILKMGHVQFKRMYVKWCVRLIWCNTDVTGDNTAVEKSISANGSEAQRTPKWESICTFSQDEFYRGIFCIRLIWDRSNKNYSEQLFRCLKVFASLFQ